MRHDTRPIRTTTRRPCRLRARRGSRPRAHGFRALPRSAACGQSIVEFSLAIPIFLALLFGTLEVGMLFKTRAAYQEAAQEAVRVVADVGGTDQAALDEIKTMLPGENLNNIVSVTIYNADASNDVPSALNQKTVYVYNQSTNSLVCANVNAASSPTATSPPHGPLCNSAPATNAYWDPSSRNTTAGSQDRIGVQIVYTYRSITGVFAPLQLTEVAVVEMEPTAYGS